MRSSFRCVLLTVVVSLVFVPVAVAAPAGTAMVEMRDGTKLTADYYFPAAGEAPFPAVVMRSTYGRGSDEFAAEYTNQGYAVVIQDVRGRGGSEGKDDAFYADGWRPNLQDGADTVAWVKTQDWCNGKIGTVGASALGITQALMAPATRLVACQYIEVAASTFYGQVSYQGGVFRKNLCEGWLEAQKIPHVIGLWKSHPSYDTFWTYYNAEAQAADVTAPGLHVGGWYDIFQLGTINTFLTRQYRGGPGAKGNQKLILKWSGHGKDMTPDLKHNENRFDLRVSDFRHEFLAYWLKGEDNGIMDKPAVHYYVMGDDTDPDAPGMEWRTADTWPPFPTSETAFYLKEDGLLSAAGPGPAGKNATFTYDPVNPFPTHGGANLFMPYGPYDQRTANADRTDLLTFATAPLAEPIEVTGHVMARLYVSTDAPDTDFTAKLIDVYPAGDDREILVLDSVQRVKYRHGFEKPAPLLESADQVVEIEIDLWHISWIFNTAHRIGLHVSSSNYPRFEKNPNTGEDFPKEDNLRAARNTVHMGAAHPSALLLPVRKPPLERDKKAADE